MSHQTNDYCRNPPTPLIWLFPLDSSGSGHCKSCTGSQPPGAGLKPPRSICCRCTRRLPGCTQGCPRPRQPGVPSMGLGALLELGCAGSRLLVWVVRWHYAVMANGVCVGTRVAQWRGTQHPALEQYCQYLSGCRDDAGAAPEMALGVSREFLSMGTVPPKPHVSTRRVGSCGVHGELGQTSPAAGQVTFEPVTISRGASPQLT